MNQLVPQTNNTNTLPPNINPKTRKPYTISKQRENWTDEEHQKFLEALTLFDRDWKKIESFVGTKTVIQIRSHAQKYFIKVQKNNTGERIPPPRPKRKSIQPYPQKQKHDAMGNFAPESLAGNQFISSSSFANWMTYRGLMPTINDSQVSPNDVQKQLEQLQQAQQYIQQAMINAQNSTRNGNITPMLTPNFPRIYAFLSNLFENNNSTFSEALSELSPVDRETMQILMHNLAINLANQQHRDNHQTLSEQYRMKKDEDDDLMNTQLNAGHLGSPRGSLSSANTTPPLTSTMTGDFYGAGDGSTPEFDQANTAHLNAAAAYHFNNGQNNNINSLYTLQNQNPMSGLNMANMNTLNMNNMALNGLNGLNGLNNNLNPTKSYLNGF